LTFNAQFNFCYPQPFQAFDYSKNCWNQTFKDLARFSDPVSQPDLSDSPTSPVKQSRSPCREPTTLVAFHRSTFVAAG